MNTGRLVTIATSESLRSGATPDPNIHSPEDLVQVYAERDWRHYRWLVAVCVEHAEPGLIVDIGAGLGFFVEACARYGLPCVGLEGSAYAVGTARGRFDVDVRHQYLSQPLPFDDGTIAAVVCNQTIEHLPPEIARHVLGESHRVLRQHGLLAIYSPSRYEPTQAAEPGHINLYTPRRLRAEVTAAGFAEYRAVDFARPIFGKSRAMRTAANLLLKLTGWPVLSASANCLAFKA